jgi:hypothetical protein
MWSWASRRPDLHLGSFQRACADDIHRLPTEDVTKRGKGFTWWRMGRWSHFPSSLFSSSSSSSPPEDLDSKGVSSPHAPAAARVALQARLHGLHAFSRSLQTRLASRRATS